MCYIPWNRNDDSGRSCKSRGHALSPEFGVMSERIISRTWQQAELTWLDFCVTKVDSFFSFIFSILEPVCCNFLCQFLLICRNLITCFLSFSYPQMKGNGAPEWIIVRFSQIFDSYNIWNFWLTRHKWNSGFTVNMLRLWGTLEWDDNFLRVRQIWTLGVRR